MGPTWTCPPKTPCEVHSEKREPRVWDWIHEPANQICVVRYDFVVLTSKRNDLWVRSGSNQPSKKRRLEAGAHDKMIKDQVASTGGDMDH